MTIRAFALSALILGCAAAGQAHAAIFAFSYSGPGVSSYGLFNTTSTPDANGRYTITSINGVRNGASMTLLPPGSFPGTDPNDNLIDATTGAIDYYGVSFNSGQNYNLFLENDGVYCELVANCQSPGGQEVSLTITRAIAYDFTYTGAGVNASGVFYTLDAPDANEFNKIVSLSGQRNNVSMSLLAPGSFPSLDPNDNLAAAGSGALDYYGLSFSAGQDYNLFLEDNGKYCEYYSSCSDPNGEEVLFSVTREGVVPEPSTWGLMMVGLGGIGAVLRRKRQSLNTEAHAAA